MNDCCEPKDNETLNKNIKSCLHIPKYSNHFSNDNSKIMSVAKLSNY